MDGNPPRAALERVYPAEYGRMVGALVRRFGAGRMQLVESALQEASLRALERWGREGVPSRPVSWLLRVAHNLTVDALRRDGRLVPLMSDAGGESADPPPSVDDELALMFLCCHPSLPRSAQIALTLNVACGFTAAQIASAFLNEKETVAQRIVRAKEKIRRAGIAFEVPGADELAKRLDPILHVVYLVFNESFAGSGNDDASGQELCRTAMRLARLLTELPLTATPEASALHALLCFQASRAEARFADDGSLLLLAEQDRTRWDAAMIQEGFTQLERAARGDRVSRFHLEAGIAALHSSAATAASTDWSGILGLYDVLRSIAPSPVVEVNRAVAVAMVSGAVAGLDELDAIPERALIGRYPYALAAYAELHASMGNFEEARSFLERAMAHQPSLAHRRLLARKLSGLGRDTSALYGHDDGGLGRQ